MVLRTKAMIEQEDVFRVSLEKQIQYAKENMAYELARKLLEEGKLPVRIRELDNHTLELEMKFEVM